MSESEIAKHAAKIVGFVYETGESMACFELCFKGGPEDGKVAKVIILIEDEDTEMEQIES